MKFNKLYNKYANLFLENVIPQEHLPVKQGEQVVFKKNWDKFPYFDTLKNSSTGERIRSMIEQKDDPLIASAISSKNPSAFGSHGSFKDNNIANESEFYVTVSQQYALGLYKNVVVVPMEVLDMVDNGNDLPRLSKNQNKEYKQTTGEKPTLNKNQADPTKQTHASWKDKGGPLPS